MDERSAEQWGKAAAALPGWTWTMPWCLLPDRHGRVFRRNWCQQDPGFGFTQVYGRVLRERRYTGDSVINPDDPGNAGCLLALVTPPHKDGYIGQVQPPRHDGEQWRIYLRMTTGDTWGSGSTLGRACIAAAEALGRWPGGAP